MNGVVYIVFDKNRKSDKLKELRYSVDSLKRIHPDLPITLFTDKDPNIKNIDNVEIVEIKSERVKQIYLEDSPYDRTLYLDCDTKIVGPIDSLFGLLDKYDIAATYDHMRKNPNWKGIWGKYDQIVECFPEFAGGVILYKKSDIVKEFFKLWRTNYKDWCKCSGRINDQPSFRVSLWETDLNVFSLPPEFNIRSKKNDNIKQRILHSHDMWKG